jgi:spermidine synthase
MAGETLNVNVGRADARERLQTHPVADAQRAGPGPAVVHCLMGVYLVSGACSLIDEVIWARLLKLILGNTVYASSVVVSVFMGGLALGAVLMGRRCDRIGRPLRLYALIELLITGFVLLSPWALRSADGLYLWFCRTWQPGPGWVILGQILISALVLLIPTVLMGSTLPLLGRVVTPLQKETGLRVGRLYALNTLGAALGCYLAGFVLIRVLGVMGTLHLAAGLNVLVALGGYAIHRLSPGGPVETRERASAATVSGRSEGRPERGLILLGLGVFISGLVSIGYELLWMRSVVHSIGAFTFVFSSVLSVYLLGNVIGAAIGSRLVRGLKDPAAAFAGMLCLLGLCGVLYLPWLNLCSYHLLPAVLDSLNEAFWHRLFSWQIVSVLIQSTILFLGPSVVMGIGFPIVLQAWVDRAHRVGLSTGTAYGINTCGAVVGGSLTGFVLIPALGLQTAIMALGLAAVWLSAVMWLTFYRPAGRRAWLRRALVPLAAVCITVQSAHVPRTLFRRIVALNRWTRGFDVLDVEEGINTTVSLHRDPKEGSHYLCTSGRKVAGTSRGYRGDQKMLGHFPVLLNARARSVLSVGFGTGESTACLSKHGLERVDCAEIAPELVRFSLKYFSELNLGPELDERVNMIYRDVRNHLHLTDRRYDAIVNDCTSIRGFAENASLYTKEYFETAREHLRPGGLFMSWIDVYTTESFEVMQSVIGTVMEVFPYVTLWYMTTEPAPFFVIVGSEEPQRYSPAHIERELARPGVRESLGVINCRDSGDVLSCYIADETDLGKYVSTYKTNSDYFPVVEFCTEHRVAGFHMLRQFFERVRSDSVYDHIDWTGVARPEKRRWLERFATTYEAATYVLLAQSTSGYLAQLEHGVAGLRVAPENAALALTKRKAERSLLAEGLKSIRAGAAAAAGTIADDILALDPDSAVGWMLRAQAERAAGNFALARAAAQRAVEIAPEELGTHFNLWTVLVSARDPKGAAAALQAGVLAAEE